MDQIGPQRASPKSLPAIAAECKQAGAILPPATHLTREQLDEALKAAKQKH